MKVSLPTPCAHHTGLLAFTLMMIGILCLLAIPYL